MQIPKIDKVVVNVGCGEARENSKVLENVVSDLSQITGMGNALANIVAANGNKVVKTNIVNDRGIHICKSMLAWQKYGNGETPESSGKKGDHLIGDYYVSFDKHYKAEVKELDRKSPRLNSSHSDRSRMPSSA